MYGIVRAEDARRPLVLRPVAAPLSLVTLLAVTACQSTGATRAMDEAGRYDTTSVHQLIVRQPFEVINLVSLLDPEHRAAASAKPDEQIDRAFAAFYTYDLGESNALKLRRNRVQERILAASTQRCNSFKQHLQRSYSRSNFAFGALSTLAGVAGAVVNGVDDAKRLAGAAGLFGGLRAEWNQDFLSNLTVNVIVSGIDARQTDLYSQVTANGQSKPIDVYTVEAAVKDALYIHGQCSVISGLQVAAESIKLAQDPGIENATQIMIRVQNAQKVANGEPPDPQLAQKLTSMRTPSNMVGTALKAAPDPENVIQELSGLVSRRATLASDILTTATKSVAALIALQKALDDGQCENKMRVVHQATIAAQAVAEGAPDPDKELGLVAYLRAKGNEAAVGSQLRRMSKNLDDAWQTFLEGKGKPNSKVEDLDTNLAAAIQTRVTNVVPSVCQ